MENPKEKIKNYGLQIKEVKEDKKEFDIKKEINYIDEKID